MAAPATGSWDRRQAEGEGPVSPATATGQETGNDILALIQAQTASVLLTSSSITSATGSSQQLLAANASRKALTIINPVANTTDWTIDPLGGTAAVGTMPGFVLRPGDSWSPVKVPTNKITGIGTAASKLVVLEG